MMTRHVGFLFEMDSGRFCGLLVCDWDRYIVLSLLSQDPRNMEQLEKAWDQEESLTSFRTIPWRSEQPENFLLNHLYIDLEHQIYAWYEDGNSSVESGG